MSIFKSAGKGIYFWQTADDSWRYQTLYIVCKMMMISFGSLYDCFIKAFRPFLMGFPLDRSTCNSEFKKVLILCYRLEKKIQTKFHTIDLCIHHHHNHMIIFGKKKRNFLKALVPQMVAQSFLNVAHEEPLKNLFHFPPTTITIVTLCPFFDANSLATAFYKTLFSRTAAYIIINDFEENGFIQPTWVYSHT